MATEWIADKNCKWCHGKGYTFVRNGPDDVDKDPCECWHEVKIVETLADAVNEAIIKMKLLRRK